MRRMLEVLWFCQRETVRALEVYLRKGLCSDSVEVDGRVLVRINFSYHGAGRRENQDFNTLRDVELGECP